jgi:hypothetical protein
MKTREKFAFITKALENEKFMRERVLRGKPGGERKITEMVTAIAYLQQIESDYRNLHHVADCVLVGRPVTAKEFITNNELGQLIIEGRD